MKKILSLVLLMCLVLSTAVGVSAGSKTARGSKSNSGSSSSRPSYTMSNGRMISSNVSYKGSINAAVIANEIAAAAKKTKKDTVTVRSVNAVSINGNTLQSMEKAGEKAGKSVMLHADTLTADNKMVQGRLYVDPSLFDEETTRIKLAVYTDKENTGDARKNLKKLYGNRITVIRCGQNGSYGVRLRISAMADLAGLDKDSLYFYSYNRTTQVLSQIKNPNYSINDAGYLHFYTNKGGDIVISDEQL